MAWQRMRTIRLEAEVAQEVDAFTIQFPRFKEAYDALIWFLARRPGVGGTSRLVGNVRWWAYVQASDPDAKTPEIWVLYQFTDDVVTIYGLNAEPAEEV